LTCNITEPNQQSEKQVSKANSSGHNEPHNHIISIIINSYSSGSLSSMLYCIHVSIHGLNNFHIHLIKLILVY